MIMENDEQSKCGIKSAYKQTTSSVCSIEGHQLHFLPPNGSPDESTPAAGLGLPFLFPGYSSRHPIDDLDAEFRRKVVPFRKPRMDLGDSILIAVCPKHHPIDDLPAEFQRKVSRFLNQG
jgi:hypothetical protein